MKTITTVALLFLSTSVLAQFGCEKYQQPIYNLSYRVWFYENQMITISNNLNLLKRSYQYNYSKIQSPMEELVRLNADSENAV